MVQSFSKTVNGSNFSLFAWSWGTRRAWGHCAELQTPDGLTFSARCRYYNSTWEAYQYQNALMCAVGAALNATALEAFSDYRATTGRVRLSADLKKQILSSCEKYNTLKALYNTL